MTRQFSIPTVLRMSPNSLLKELFIDLGYPELDQDWDRMKARDRTDSRSDQRATPRPATKD